LPLAPDSTRRQPSFRQTRGTGRGLLEQDAANRRPMFSRASATYQLGISLPVFTSVCVAIGFWSFGPVP
jgi:hypothetical protein